MTTTPIDPRGPSGRVLGWLALVKVVALVLIALGRPLLTRRMSHSARR